MDGSCGLYYKQVSIVNDDSSVISKWIFKLSDDPWVFIYDRDRFIIQATDFVFLIFFFKKLVLFLQLRKSFFFP
jgi:hypothetical protein